MNIDLPDPMPRSTAIGVAWVAFAVGLLVAAVLAVAARPDTTVVTVAATTTVAEPSVKIAGGVTTIRVTTTAKPTTTTTEAPPTTRYVPPPTAPPTISQSTSETIQRIALEQTFEGGGGTMSVAELCDGIDMVGLDLAVDTFMNGANDAAGPGDMNFDRWVVEDYFTDTCGL